MTDLIMTVLAQNPQIKTVIKLGANVYNTFITTLKVAAELDIPFRLTYPIAI